MCKIAVAASGTITLQIALKKIPMCVFYKISSSTFFIIKYLVKIKFISLVNIVLGKKIVEEFVQNNASVSNIQNEIEKINFDSDYRQSLIKNISSIEKVLFDRIEGDFFVGRSQYDSPDVDNEILVPKSSGFIRIVWGGQLIVNLRIQNINK